MKKIFLDTNILVYTIDRRDPEKHAGARAALGSFKRQLAGVISTQVLQEFAAIALLKFSQPEEAVIEELTVFENFEVVLATPALIRRGVELRKKYQVHFWDATLIAAAEQAGCEALYSEDFQHGMTFGNVRVENPLI
jgi:predicted nucleic acid-binding protein